MGGRLLGLGMARGAGGGFGQQRGHPAVVRHRGWHEGPEPVGSVTTGVPRGSWGGQSCPQPPVRVSLGTLVAGEKNSGAGGVGGVARQGEGQRGVKPWASHHEASFGIVGDQ